MSAWRSNQCHHGATAAGKEDALERILRISGRAHLLRGPFGLAQAEFRA